MKGRDLLICEAKLTTSCCVTGVESYENRSPGFKVTLIKQVIKSNNKPT